MNIPEKAYETSPSATSGDRSLATRLEELKREAVMHAGDPSTGELDGKIISMAARSLAKRRAQRGDYVGTLIWESVAARAETEAEPSKHAKNIDPPEPTPTDGECGQRSTTRLTPE